MKHGRTISVKSPCLRNLRNNLRLIYYKFELGLSSFYREKCNEIGERKKAAKNRNDEEEYYKLLSQWNKTDNKQVELGRAFHKSICKCYLCQSLDRDMTYSERDGYWYCVPCFEQLHLDPASITLNLSRKQIGEFLDLLAGPKGCQFDGFKSKCKTEGREPLFYAKKIFRLMDVPEDEQEKFFKLAKFYGGYCDCEILMNAAPHLLGEESPW